MRRVVMVNSAAKGSRAERELVNMIDETAWEVIRIPASGSATTRKLPDLLALRWTPVSRIGHPVSESIAIEAKAADSGSVSLSRKEVDDLIAFARDAGARPYIAVRPNFVTSDYDEWQFLSAHTLNQTGSGYSVRQCDLPGFSFDDLFNHSSRPVGIARPSTTTSGS